MNQAVYGRDMARITIEAGAVAIDTETPFVWSSGIRSPLYCDHRMLVADTRSRRFIVHTLATITRDRFGPADAVAGVPLAAIPWAAWLAYDMDLPLLVVRHEAKGHGHRRRIEGSSGKLSAAVVIEDAVSTGGSAIRTAKALRNAGISVMGVIAILDYQISGLAFEREGLRLYAAYTYESLRAELGVYGRSDPNVLAAVDSWYHELGMGS